MNYFMSCLVDGRPKVILEIYDYEDVKKLRQDLLQLGLDIKVHADWYEIRRSQVGEWFSCSEVPGTNESLYIHRAGYFGFVAV